VSRPHRDAERALLTRTAELAADYATTPDTRPVRPGADYAAALERSCASAAAIADGLAALPGYQILNEVALNQVLLRFESDERTAAILAAVQREGEAWPSHATWEGRKAIRVSVSCWRTSGDDVRRTLDAFGRAAAAA